MYYGESVFVFLADSFANFKISLRDLSIPTNCRTRRQKMSWIMGEGRGPASSSVGCSGQYTSDVSTNVLIEGEFVF